MARRKRVNKTVTASARERVGVEVVEVPDTASARERVGVEV